MASEFITLAVDAEAARIYQTASEEERRKLDILISLQLLQAGKHEPSLRDVMQMISERAQERGLRPTPPNAVQE